LCLVTVVAVWALAALRRPHGAMVLDGVAPIGAIAAFLIFSPLLSPQFMIWIVPFAAIVAARGDKLIAGLVFGVVVLSVADLNLVWELVHTALFAPQAIVVARNLLLVALVGVCLARLIQGVRWPAVSVPAPVSVEAAA
jgi:hypothetical protein